jgi:diaminopimelate epimerase
MGPPRLKVHDLESWCNLALLGSNDLDLGIVSSVDAFVNTQISGIPLIADLPEWRITVVSMGNPHAVSLYFLDA